MSSASEMRRQASQLLKAAEEAEKEAIEVVSMVCEKIMGVEVVRVACRECSGTGKFIDDYDPDECSECSGAGWEPRPRWTGKKKYPMLLNELPFRLSFKWRTAAGHELEPSDFEDHHLINTINLIGRNISGGIEPTCPAVYPFLLIEAIQREMVEIREGAIVPGTGSSFLPATLPHFVIVDHHYEALEEIHA